MTHSGSKAAVMASALPCGTGSAVAFPVAGSMRVTPAPRRRSGSRPRGVLPQGRVHHRHRDDGCPVSECLVQGAHDAAVRDAQPTSRLC